MHKPISQRFFGINIFALSLGSSDFYSNVPIIKLEALTLKKFPGLVFQGAIDWLLFDQSGSAGCIPRSNASIAFLTFAAISP